MSPSEKRWLKYWEQRRCKGGCKFKQAEAKFRTNSQGETLLCCGVCGIPYVRTLQLTLMHMGVEL